jgi:hypothetical protein
VAQYHKGAFTVRSGGVFAAFDNATKAKANAVSVVGHYYKGAFAVCASSATATADTAANIGTATNNATDTANAAVYINDVDVVGIGVDFDYT